MSTNHRLRQLAEKLPSMPKFDNGKVRTTVLKKELLGEDILLENKDAKTQKGEAIDPKKYYVQSYLQPIYCNHFDELKKAHNSNKVQGVVDYITTVYKYNKMEVPAELDKII